tara:strand:- start:669 stop:1550 length:882 start_codon:yes stop_codon:yes gene_type:complete
MEKLTLILKTSIYNQIQHLLKLYPNTEWSGLGFYNKIEPDERGWAEKWELEAFFPLDLGSTAATEFSGEDELKFLDTVYDKYPKLRKCFRGLIHSHHSLGGGAFFSGTDKGHLEECANSVCYPSLVVALQETGSPFAFAISWEDQFGRIGMTDSKDATIVVKQPDYKPKGLFEECIKELKKQEKKAKTNTQMTYYNRNQGTLFNMRKGYPGLESDNQVNNARQPGNFFNYYDPDIKDNKYQQLRLNYDKADELFMDAPVGSPNHDLLQQNSIEAERKLDDYCIEKDYNQEWGF